MDKGGLMRTVVDSYRLIDRSTWPSGMVAVWSTEVTIYFVTHTLTVLSKKPLLDISQTNIFWTGLLTNPDISFKIHWGDLVLVSVLVGDRSQDPEWNEKAFSVNGQFIVGGLVDEIRIHNWSDSCGRSQVIIGLCTSYYGFQGYHCGFKRYRGS